LQYSVFVANRNIYKYVDIFKINKMRGKMEKDSEEEEPFDEIIDELDLDD